jgi:hypothetical protein
VRPTSLENRPDIQSSFRVAYAYVTRHFAISPLKSIHSLEDRQEAVQQISRLVPFLTDKKSIVVHGNMSIAVRDIWSRMSLVSTELRMVSKAKLMPLLAVSVVQCTFCSTERRWNSVKTP